MWNDRRRDDLAMAIGGTALGLGAIGVYCVSNFRTAKASEMLIKTGLGVRGNRAGRAMMRFPGQSITRVSLRPTTISVTTKCLSGGEPGNEEFLPIIVPIKVTVVPFNPESSRKYTFTKPTTNESVEYTSGQLFANYANCFATSEPDAIIEVVEGVVRGETRVQVASMKIDEINRDRDKFRIVVEKCFANILAETGLSVINTNVEELIEEQRANNEQGYIQSREKRKLSSVVNQSKIDVMENEKMQRIQVAELEAETKRKELEQRALIASAEADLAEAEAASHRRSEIAQVEAQMARDSREQELGRKLEELRASQELEAKRADKLTDIKVVSESLIRQAEGERDAAIERARGQAEGIRLVAEAERMQREALAKATEAELMAKANGELAMLQARAEGARQMVEACGHDADVLISFLNVHNGIPQAAFESAAKAVQGLNPHLFSMSGDTLGAQLGQVIGGMAPVIEAFKAMQPSKTNKSKETVKKITIEPPTTTTN